MSQTKFNPSKYFKINTEDPLFEELKKNPEWWKTLKENKALYINLRKNEKNGSSPYISVYYKGRRVANLKWKKGDIVSVINSAYIGKKDHKDTEIKPIDIVNNLSQIIATIENEYVINAKKNPEGDSEEGIKADLFKKGSFIDTEFAIMRRARKEEILEREKRNKKKDEKLREQGKPVPTRTISEYAQDRIDLVHLSDDGIIQFVELKRISDSRMNNHNKDGETKIAEINEQLEDYSTFVTQNREKILKYYKDVLSIMKRLQINKHITDINITDVSTSIRLHIAGYTKYTEDRKTRIKEMKKMIESQHIDSNIEDVYSKFLKLPK